jgi:hypothetical protein
MRRGSTSRGGRTGREKKSVTELSLYDNGLFRLQNWPVNAQAYLGSVIGPRSSCNRGPQIVKQFVLLFQLLHVLCAVGPN